MTISMALMNVLAESPLDHIVDHPIYEWNGWWVLTNHMVMICLSALLMLLIFPFITRAYRDGEHVPTGTRNFFEAILVYFREEVAKPLLKERADDYIGYIWTMFFFILFMNVLGLLPLDLLTGPMLAMVGLHPLGHGGHGIFGTATSNFWVTGALALVSFIVIHNSGWNAGPKHYLKHYLGGAPWYLAPIMVPIEALGAVMKPFALMVRLGANMTAGHILLAVVIGFVAMATTAIGVMGGLSVGIVAVLGGIFLMCLELFVAVLQAYLFTFLTVMFIAQVITHHDDGHEHGHAGGSSHH